MIRRHFFTLAAAVSLLLCAATCALWVRSYWRAEIVEVAFNQTTVISAAWIKGRLQVIYAHDEVDPTRFGGYVAPFTYREEVASNSDIIPNFFWDPNASAEWRGFGYANYSYSQWGFDLKTVRVPCWLVFTLFAALPASIAIRDRRTARRRRLFHCIACGYDLRATPDRCPECGMKAVQP